MSRKNIEEYKVMIKFAEPGMTINSIKLTKSLNKALGDGSLIIMCKDEKQQKKALSINSMLGFSVTCTLMKTKPWVRGVITGIPTDVKNCVKGGKVIGAKRLQYVKNKSWTVYWLCFSLMKKECQRG